MASFLPQDPRKQLMLLIAILSAGVGAMYFNYLHRPLFEQYPDLLGPGGLLVFAHPTISNLERNPAPSARFLLEEDELQQLAAGLDVITCDEAWRDDGRHVARLMARKRS